MALRMPGMALQMPGMALQMPGMALRMPRLALHMPGMALGMPGLALHKCDQSRGICRTLSCTQEFGQPIHQEDSESGSGPSS
jgi:hypothetical protein